MFNFVMTMVIFVCIYLFYLFFVIFRKKKLNKFKKNAYVRVLVNKYHVDLDTVNFKILVNIIALTNAFIISSAFFIMNIFDNFYIGIFVGFAVLIIMELLMYKLIGTMFRKKEK